MNTCENCLFRVFNECHFEPPVRLPRKFISPKDRTRDEELIWGWPQISLKDWCGCYKKRVS